MSVRSMTGFGRAASGNVAVSLSSVNRRQFDMAFQLPRALQIHERRIQAQLRDSLHRGRVTGSVQWLEANQPMEVEVDYSLAQRLLDSLRDAAKTLGVSDDISIQDLVQLPEVVHLKPVSADEDTVWEAVSPVLAVAIDDLVKSREREGDVLAQIS